MFWLHPFLAFLEVIGTGEMLSKFLSEVSRRPVETPKNWTLFFRGFRPVEPGRLFRGLKRREFGVRISRILPAEIFLSPIDVLVRESRKFALKFVNFWEF